MTSYMLPVSLSYLFAVFPLHVEEVCGVDAPVDALLVTCDAALDGDALRCGLQNKVVQILRYLRRERPTHGALGRLPIINLSREKIITCS